MNKKTIIIACSSIIGLILVILLASFLISVLKPHYFSYEEVEAKIIEATKSYYKNNPTLLPADEGEYSLLYSTLVDNKYIKPLNQLLANGDKCNIQITINKYGENYLYIPYLSCPGEYENKELYKAILDNNSIATMGSGLYKASDESYFFKGENVNTYVKFGSYQANKKTREDILWKIVSISPDNIVKLVSLTGTKKGYKWDDRYNIDKKSNYGYNDFEKSRLKEALVNLASSDEILNDSEKAKLVPQKLCIGKRSLEQDVNDGSIECSVMSEDDMLYGTITPYEYLRASLDENCSKIKDRSCVNYNYLSKKESSSEWSITAFADSTHQSYSFDGRGFNEISNNSERKIYVTINLNKYTFYKSGSGTLADPYLIK